MKSKFFLTVVVRLIASIAVLLLTLVTSYVLTPEDTGLFFMYFTIVSFVSVLSRGGVDELLIKNIGINSKMIMPNLNFSFRLLLFYIVPSFIVGIFTIYFSSITLSKSIALSLFFSILCISISSLLGRIFQAVGKNNIAIFILNLMLPVSIVITLGLGIVFDFNIDFDYLVNSVLASSVFVFILSLFLYVYEFGFHVDRIPFFYNCQDFYKFTKTSFRLLLIVVLQNIIPWSLIFIVDRNLNINDVAVFNFMQKIASLNSFFIICLNFVISSSFARKYSSNGKVFYVLYKKTFLGVFLGSLACGVIIAVIYKIFIPLYNEMYSRYMISFLILDISYVFYSCCIFVSMVCAMTGNEKLSLNIYVFLTPCYFILSLYFSKVFGMVGLVSVSFIIYFVQLFLQCVFLKKKLVR